MLQEFPEHISVSLLQKKDLNGLCKVCILLRIPGTMNYLFCSEHILILFFPERQLCIFMDLLIGNISTSMSLSLPALTVQDSPHVEFLFIKSHRKLTCLELPRYKPVSDIA